MSYVDLHCHLLPGIDDGASTPADALAHGRRLEAAGVRDVACTPHIKQAHFPGVRIDALDALRRGTQAEFEAAGLRVRLHRGGELAHLDALELGERDLAAIAQGPAHAPWLLLESPFAGFDSVFEAAAGRLRRLGYGLLLAHPERSAGVLKSGLGLLEAWADDGVRLQVNVASLSGANGAAAHKAARTLLRRGLVHVIASDGHPGTREETLDSGFECLLAAGATRSQALRLTERNPRLLLDHGLRADAGALAA